ncbi:hypothetical protein PHYSODRAFT_331244 [Phytophthora sojae]|uniref:Uncharacterized protein n=1 Tax=Phytophthora sojae (strain P6497) TaxID=1094619 RepID=G4ZIJ3_PHYSP|nr:hypothetical protein PHYSODRAFT_331244 [Phytophthora sojae]EGZ17237.1 hypothetical protein PHYSODRAFT_331244 [Phytophthora sojae]|eukprot:XP_009526295.1 hypothetical protein PHYSODRAFT_331244 [Phytophthora sojae]
MLEDRSSRISDLKLTRSGGSLYSNMGSPFKPVDTDPENGALREGEPLSLMSKECVGLLAQYAGVGFLAGIIPGVIYPVLQGYLNAEATSPRTEPLQHPGSLPLQHRNGMRRRKMSKILAMKSSRVSERKHHQQSSKEAMGEAEKMQQHHRSGQQVGKMPRHTALCKLYYLVGEDAKSDVVQLKMPSVATEACLVSAERVKSTQVSGYIVAALLSKSALPPPLGSESSGNARTFGCHRERAWLPLADVYDTSMVRVRRCLRSTHEDAEPDEVGAQWKRLRRTSRRRVSPVAGAAAAAATPSAVTASRSWATAVVRTWSSAVVILFIMAAMSVPDPYYGDASMHNIDEEEWTPEQIASINEIASSSAGKYVVPMMLASFGYLLYEVAADAMVVEYAQREPIEQRGRVQTAVYAVKTSFTALGAAQLMLISGIICAPLVFVLWFLLHEDRIVAYKFFAGVFNSRVVEQH